MDVNTSPGSREYYKGSLSVNQRSVIAARIDIMAKYCKKFFLAKVGVTRDPTDQQMDQTRIQLLVDLASPRRTYCDRPSMTDTTG